MKPLKGVDAISSRFTLKILGAKERNHNGSFVKEAQDYLS